MGLFSRKKKQEISVDTIWEIDNPNEFALAMDSYIRKKCEGGSKLSALSHPEKMYYIAMEVEAAVMCDGLYELFSQYSGRFLNQMVDAFIEIGALEAAGTCKKAVEAFVNGIPDDLDERQEAMDEMGPEFEELLQECDSAFNEYSDTLIFDRYKYCQEHRREFGH